MPEDENAERLLTPREVAQMMRVDPKSVTRWAKTGLIPADQIIRTLGGHRRFRAAFILDSLRHDEHRP